MSPDFRLPPQLRGARAAFIFLTRIPIGGFPFSKDDWQWSSGYFPFVGALLGAMHVGIFLAAQRAGLDVAIAVTIGCSMLLTGAFHEDGLADSADALGGAFDRKRLFEILKDSRIGSFGAAALICAVLIKFCGLRTLGAAVPVAMLVTQCASRTPPIWLMATIPYVTNDEASKSKLVTRATWRQAALATLWPVVVCGVAYRLQLLTLIDLLALSIAALVTAGVCAYRFIRRAGGITGDFLGACQQVTELLMLFALAWVRGKP
jgi:adenosylcobinamide-GDP ribazoletransferase